MVIEVDDPNESVYDLLARMQKSEDEKTLPTNSKGKTVKHEDVASIDITEFRQLQQKQALSSGLTHILFKKFEEMNPTKKQSSIHFEDLSWYKDKLDSQA
jgi:hypothetical protein